jgi:hypothetical protein
MIWTGGFLGVSPFVDILPPTIQPDTSASSVSIIESNDGLREGINHSTCDPSSDANDVYYYGLPKDDQYTLLKRLFHELGPNFAARTSIQLK